MISLVVPYWERQAAADAALGSLAGCYPALDLEVVVVDDGSRHGFRIPRGLPFEVQALYLPGKTEPLNPCLPFNTGVAAAKGNFIALSGVEMLHRRPVLAAMRAVIEQEGPLCYVTAACWSDEGRWHAHSSLLPLAEEGVPMPAGAHYHFMTMLSRDLWEAAAGFDCDYRGGAGYEDPDFLLRLQRAGAQFVMRDDLVVEHPRKGVRSAWTRAMHERNRQVFRGKWCS